MLNVNKNSKPMTNYIILRINFVLIGDYTTSMIKLDCKNVSLN